MSTTIDHKVVEMRFDNKHFEQHTRESMSTLDKLKAKLNFKDSAKSLQELNSSANKVNMNGLTSALDSCHSKFSALEVMGVTALANITNSAVNAGKRILNSLTLEPITTGFNEYELKMDSVKTIMASTGESVEKVNEYLEELNEYSDQTIYSFSDMTQNIGKFTNAGVKLEDAVMAIKGISNEAAVSGANANEASRAMYNFAQALSAGYVKLIDWKSIELANMATKEFKQQLIDSAVAIGTLTETSDGMYQTLSGTVITATQNFNESLQDQWMTTDVLVSTLKDYADNTTEIGKKAFAAAQDVTKFSQMLDVLKETAQSGWARTWEIIFGNIEQAKALFTPLTNFFSGIIDSMSDFRNAVLDNALTRNFRNIFENTSVKKLSEGISGITKSLEYYQDMVNRVWRGDYKNQPYRSGLLEAEGHNYKVIQTLVNKGYQYKLTVEDVAEAEKLLGKETTKTAEATEEATKATEEQLLALIKMSDAELEAAGYTKEQVEALRELESVAKKVGIPIEEFIKKLDKIDGRWLIFESFANVGRMFANAASIIKQAWNDIFNPGLDQDGIIEKRGNALFNIIAAVHKLTRKLPKLRDENGKLTKTGENLLRTFKGIFAVIDLITSIISGGFKLALAIVKKVLSLFNIDLLQFTAIIGDGLVALRDWIKNNLYLAEIIEFIAKIIVKAVLAIKDWITHNENIINGVKKLKSKLSDASKVMKDWFGGLKSWISGIKDAENIPKYIFDGLINGLKTGAGKVFGFMIEFGKGILNAIKSILGIHSPSTEFHEIGTNIVQGLYNGISSTIKMVYDLIMSVGGKLIEIVKNLDLGSLFTIAIGAGSVYGIITIAKALESLSKPIEVFADIGETFNVTLKRFNGVLSAVKFRLITEGVKTLAISLAILAGSIAVLSMLDQKKVWSAVGAIFALGVILGGLSVVIGKFGPKEGVEFGKLALTLLALGISISLIASALKKISNIDPEQGKQTILGFVGIVVALGALIAISNKTKSGFVKLGSAFLGIAAALLIMAFVAKILGNMHPEELEQGGKAIGMFAVVIAGLMLATKLISGSKNVDKIAKTIGKIGTAILMMAIVAKMLGGMDEYELKQGLMAITAFGLIITGLMAATKLITGSTNVGKIGGAIAGIAGAMLMMAVSVRVLGMMDPASLAKGIIAVTALGGIVTGLIWATKLAGKDLDRVGRTILMVSIAVGLLGITATLLSLISWEGLAKGVIAVGFLSAFMAGLMFVTKFVPQKIMGSLIAITAAIAVLALSLGILSAIDPKRLVGATIALGVVLGMFGLVIAATSLVPQAMGTMIAISVAIGLLGGALIALGQLPIEQSLGAAAGLSLVLLALAGMLGVLALVGMGGPAALIGIASLAVAIVGIGGLIIAIGALMDKFPKLEEFLDKGIPILEKIGNAIGSFFGNIVSGFATAAASGLPEIGTMLSQFMGNALPFINGMKLVDAKTLAGVGILAAAIIALTAANLLNQIVSFYTLGSSFADLGTQLSQFMINARPFIATAMMIPPGVVESVKALAETILILTAANLIDGITKFLTGSSSLEHFGSQLKYLAIGLREFISELGPISPEQVETAKNAAEIIKTLATAAKKIPNTGGLLGDLVGDNDMSTWAKQLPIMAEGVIGFVNKLIESGIDSSSIEVADTAAKIITTLASAAKEIPNAGGLLAGLVGDNELSTFARELPNVGKGIVGFIQTLTEGNITSEQAEVANTAAKIIKTLASAAKEIPNAGGWLASMIGDNELSNFAKELPNVGSGLAGFAKELGSFDKSKITTVNSAIDVLKTVIDLSKIDIEGVSSNLSTLGKNLVKFAKKIKSFAEHMADVGSKSVEASISKINKLIDMARTMTEIDSESLKTFAESLKKIAKSGVKEFVNEFSGKESINDVEDGVNKLLKTAIDAFGNRSKKDEIKSKAAALAEEAINAMSSKRLKSDAKQAGKDLCQGLINGLKNKDKRQEVYDAAYALGQLAVQGEKDGQASNSPSKATEQAGKWLGEGLVIGIQKMSSRVYGAGKSMGEEATNSISSALNTAMNLINSDMDTQPTIRPVLDLSDVESGVGSLSSMFNGPSLGVAANLKAINSGMNARNQNGTNNDVVSAINKLGRSLGNVGGDTYNINGVTANDDSGLADAVRTIIRAAKVERRS